MKIKSMTASFGKLRNAHLALGEGLNLLQAPNEGGKSTWCAFLRAMFYGIPTRERDRQGYLAEKNRYQPWEGGAMEGEVTLTWKGKDITLRRGAKGSTPFGAFSAVDTATGEPVPGLTGENCGEVLLGVSREVYERSAFVGQGGAVIAHDVELERRIAALVSSGEEDVSYTEVEGRLKKWQRYRKHNQTGLIPKLENEQSVLKDTLLRQSRARGQAEEARREAERLTVDRDALRHALSAYEQAENCQRYERYQAAQAALMAAERDVEEAQAAAQRTPDSDTLRQAQGDLAYYNTLEANRRMAESQIEPARAEAQERQRAAENPLFPNLSADEAWQQASRDRDRAAAKFPGGIYVKLAYAVLAGMVLWFGFLLVMVFQKWQIESWMYGALLVAGLGFIAMNTMNTRRAMAWRTETEELLARYSAQYPDDILACANSYRETVVAAQEAQRKLETVEHAAAELVEQKKVLLEGLLTLVHTFEPHVTDLFGVSAAISKGLLVQGKLGEARVRLEGARALAESLPKPDFRPVQEAGGDAALTEEIAPEELAARLAAVEGELSRRKNDLALATGELNTLGDSALFESRREEIEEELERRREEYDAIAEALSALADANGELQARFSPALNERAGEILSALTGGKYHKVGLNRQFEAVAHEAGGTLPRSTLALSQGTAEQVYLAARLAVCALALPEDEPAPLVLDDALDAFDDERMALALDYLLKLGEARQILLFSCHSREAAYLKGKACNHTAIGV